MIVKTVDLGQTALLLEPEECRLLALACDVAAQDELEGHPHAHQFFGVASALFQALTFAAYAQLFLPLAEYTDYTNHLESLTFA